MRWYLLVALAACDDAAPADDVACDEVAEPEVIAGGCGAVGEHCTISLACGAELPGCERWLGDLHVPDPGEPDAFASISELRRVDGGFTVFRPHAVPDMRALDDLESVGGQFSIRLDSNGALRSLDGLERLVAVGELVIQHNGGLTSLRGLGSLRRVHGDVRIEGNTSLPRAEIDRLLGCLTVDGTITIEGNAP